MRAVTYSVRVFNLRVSASAVLNFSWQLLIDNEQRNFTHIWTVFGALNFNFLVSVDIQVNMYIESRRNPPGIINGCISEFPCVEYRYRIVGSSCRIWFIGFQLSLR